MKTGFVLQAPASIVFKQNYDKSKQKILQSAEYFSSER